MPPGRRGRPAGSTNTRPKTPQQRLSFGPNAPNKITKPSTSSSLAQDAKKKLSPKQKSQLEKIASESPITSPAATSEDDVPKVEAMAEKESSQALPIRRNEKIEGMKVEGGRDQKEEQALKVSEAQIRKYWLLKEDARKAPRVHQQGMSVHEKVLREWDLSSQFGVCSCLPD